MSECFFFICKKLFFFYHYVKNRHKRGKEDTSYGEYDPIYMPIVTDKAPKEVDGYKYAPINKAYSLLNTNIFLFLRLKLALAKKPLKA